MKEFTYTITDEHGVHARPAGLLANTAKRYTASVSVACREKQADGKRLLALMSLGARRGDALHFCIEGSDEAEAAETLARTCGDLL